MQTEALAAAKQYEKDAVDRIRRIAIISADLEAKGTKKKGGNGGRGGGAGDLRGGYAPWGEDGDNMSDYQASVLASQY